VLPGNLNRGSDELGDYVIHAKILTWVDLPPHETWQTFTRLVFDIMFGKKGKQLQKISLLTELG
jgi:hypothetical protein